MSSQNMLGLLLVLVAIYTEYSLLTELCAHGRVSIDRRATLCRCVSSSDDLEVVRLGSLVRSICCWIKVCVGNEAGLSCQSTQRLFILSSCAVWGSSTLSPLSAQCISCKFLDALTTKHGFAGRAPILEGCFEGLLIDVLQSVRGLGWESSSRLSAVHFLSVVEQLRCSKGESSISSWNRLFYVSAAAVDGTGGILCPSLRKGARDFNRCTEPELILFTVSSEIVGLVEQDRS